MCQSAVLWYDMLSNPHSCGCKPSTFAWHAAECYCYQYLYGCRKVINSQRCGPPLHAAKQFKMGWELGRRGGKYASGRHEMIDKTRTTGLCPCPSPGKTLSALTASQTSHFHCKAQIKTRCGNVFRQQFFTSLSSFHQWSGDSFKCLRL